MEPKRSRMAELLTDWLERLRSQHDFPAPGASRLQRRGRGGPHLNSRRPGALKPRGHSGRERYGSNQMLAAEDSPGMWRDVFAAWTW